MKWTLFSHRNVIIFFLYLSLPLLLTSCKEKETTQTFYTWEGIGPDKWASVWLINRKIDPEATIRFIPVNEDLPEATAFDVPNSNFVRTNDTSAVAKMVSAYTTRS